VVGHARTEKFDAVIHCAALAYEGVSVFSPSLVTENIFSGTMSVASACLEHTKLFINCSSMARYGDIAVPFREGDKPLPADPYGLAKLQAEEQLTLLSQIYPSFKFYTVVPHNVSGACQVYTDPYRNVLSIMIHRALQGKPIYIYGDGSQKRSFSHVDDCVDAIDRLIEIQPRAVLPTDNVYNIGPDGNEISIKALADKIVVDLGSKSEIRYLDPRPQEVKYAWCSSDRAKKVLKYEARKNLDDIILDIKNYILENGFYDFNYYLRLELKAKKAPRTWTEQLFNDRDTRGY
jgi:UDP-glucose 4-epimerase